MAVEPEIIENRNSKTSNDENKNSSSSRRNFANFRIYKFNGLKAFLFFITIAYAIVTVGWNIIISLFDPILLILILLNILAWKFLK